MWIDTVTCSFCPICTCAVKELKCAFSFDAVDKYQHLCNGEEEAKVKAFLAEEHTFEEYCKVSITKWKAHLMPKELIYPYIGISPTGSVTSNTY